MSTKKTKAARPSKSVRQILQCARDKIASQPKDGHTHSWGQSIIDAASGETVGYSYCTVGALNVCVVGGQHHARFNDDNFMFELFPKSTVPARVVGALYDALPKPYQTGGKYDEYGHAREDKLKPLQQINYLINYNDADGRTQRALVNLFDRALASLDKK